jgi:hypothetical protein
MNNYWLDRRSNRVSGSSPQDGSVLTGDDAQAVPPHVSVTYRVELRQGGHVVVPRCRAKVVSRLDKLDITFDDDGEFPIESYEWIAAGYDWGRKSGPAVDVVVKKFVGRRRVSRTVVSSRVTGMEFDHVGDEPLRVVIHFEKV